MLVCILVVGTSDNHTTTQRQDSIWRTHGTLRARAPDHSIRLVGLID